MWLYSLVIPSISGEILTLVHMRSKRPRLNFEYYPTLPKLWNSSNPIRANKNCIRHRGWGWGAIQPEINSTGASVNYPYRILPGGVEGLGLRVPGSTDLRVCLHLKPKIQIIPQESYRGHGLGCWLRV